MTEPFTHVRVTVEVHVLVTKPEHAAILVSDALEEADLSVVEESLRLEYLHGGTWVPARVADAP